MHPALRRAFHRTVDAIEQIGYGARVFFTHLREAISGTWPMSHFVYWVMGIAVAAWMVTSDFLSIRMVGMALVYTTCGGTIGWVHGYSDRDMEARQEVLLRENSIGRN